jgi:transposase
MKPTYEELEARIYKLEAYIRLLEERLNLNSKNSSKPPSTDQKADHTPPRKGGAIPGHPGHFRPLKAAHKIIEHKPHVCSRCGSCNLRLGKPWIFQQTELPPIELLVTEYRCFRAVCRDCKNREAPMPPPGIEPSAFGPCLSAATAMLTGAYHMGKRKAKGLLSALLGTEISLGSISNIEGRMTHGLQETQEEIRKNVIESQEPKYIDETGWRQQASRRTAWIVSTKQGAYYAILSSRGRKALKKIVRKKLQTPVTTDRYAVYNFRRHQWCLAHIQRDFKRISERSGPDGPLGHRLLFELREVFGIHKAGYEPEEKYRRLYYRRKRMEEILQEAEVEGSPRLQSFAWKLLDNYKKLWLFSHKASVEPTNNQAERDLRPLVIWRKICLQTWSDRGSRFIERIMSAHMTLKRQGKNVLMFLSSVYAGRIDPQLRPTVF